VAIDDDQMATVELAEVTRKVALDLVPETKVGDYVIVHVGFAIQRLDEVEARKTLSLLDELAAVTEQPDT
jgi:hydrogenase expression/formation protein HypC